GPVQPGGGPFTVFWKGPAIAPAPVLRARRKGRSRTAQRVRKAPAPSAFGPPVAVLDPQRNFKRMLNSNTTFGLGNPFSGCGKKESSRPRRGQELPRDVRVGGRRLSLSAIA